MTYYVCLLDKNDNGLFALDQVVCGRIDKAKKEYDNFKKEAFHGEVLLAYKTNVNYDNIMPTVALKKKTDWRYGSDVDSEPRDRRKFLKFKYMGKAYNY